MQIDGTDLMKRLETLRPEKKKQGAEAAIQEISLAAALPALTQINHEREYLLCRQVAKRLTGSIREPEILELEN